MDFDREGGGAAVAVGQSNLAGSDFFHADSLCGCGDCGHGRIAGGCFHDLFVAGSQIDHVNEVPDIADIAGEHLLFQADSGRVAVDGDFDLEFHRVLDIVNLEILSVLVKQGFDGVLIRESDRKIGISEIIGKKIRSGIAEGTDHAVTSVVRLKFASGGSIDPCVEPAVDQVYDCRFRSQIRPFAIGRDPDAVVNRREGNVHAETAGVQIGITAEAEIFGELDFVVVPVDIKSAGGKLL